ncbi:TIR domain-containing protein [Prosthecobacter sp.]|uniref:TIR domain-containing protein n=1 Tax=Prosthecobacter sp. TaxID=1965333 RepID=UPI002AB84804|nr:TIR domain-containing protein [Prosthecobacter sp.]MDZ4405978.1 TIR domain-containing protein [Prosthecobacter sp.]
MASDSSSPASYDFFISYTGVDQAWAEWIAWHLEAVGYTTIIQAWDFKAGGVFPADMHHALQQSARVLCVLSPEYMLSDYCEAEWLSAFKSDPVGKLGRLVLVRVVDCKPSGLLDGRTYIDLVGKQADAAISILLERLKAARAKPASPPHPPSISKPIATPPIFPGTPTNNLPSLQPFFGREKEIADIRAAIAPDSHTWGTLIDGEGGMGKTSLAVSVAYNFPATQFKKIIFVSVKQREMDDHKERKLDGFALSTWLEMLNIIAHELGQNDITKSPENERAKLVKEALRGQQVFLVLDNLETLSEAEQDQLFTFLEYLPSGCKAILTSRIFFGNKLQAIKLHELDQVSALKLFDEIAKHNKSFAQSTKEERINLYEKTGGRPLLMRWVAGQVGSGHCTCLADALAHLRSCPDGNDALSFVFGDLLSSLTGADVKILASLTFPSQSIPVKVVAEISGVVLEHAHRRLKLLTNRSLVVSDPEGKEYTLVPMVADFLRKSRPEVVNEIGSRLEQHSYALIVKNGGRDNGHFEALDATWSIIAPALRLFLAGPNDRLQIVCDALHGFFNFKGHWDDWFSLTHDAEVRAVAAADFLKAGWRAYDTGSIHHLRGEPAEVLICADRAAAYWLKAPAGVYEQAAAIQLRGCGHCLAKNYSAAIVAHRESVELRKASGGEFIDIAAELNWLAGAEQHSGDFSSAERDYSEALSIARAIKHPEGIVTYTGNLAELALVREDWIGAETLAREALTLAEKVGRLELIATDSARLALALARQGRKSEALTYAQCAVNIFTKLGHSAFVAAQEVLRECEAAV